MGRLFTVEPFMMVVMLVIAGGDDNIQSTSRI
jgi:hypothetical protein